MHKLLSHTAVTPTPAVNDNLEVYQKKKVVFVIFITSKKIPFWDTLHAVAKNIDMYIM